MTRRVLVVLGLLVGLAVAAAPSSYAVARVEPEPPARCFQPNADGDLPTCMWNGTRWIRTYDGGMDVGGPDGGGGGFAAVFVLAILVGIGITVYKVSLARRMAERSGMSPGEATAMTLLSDDGLDATYLASNLRGPGTTPPPAGTAAPSPTRSTEARLRELASLRDQGLLTPEEYAARRAAVLDSL